MDAEASFGALLTRAWESAAIHAALIVVPCLTYAALASFASLALAGRRRREVWDGFGAVVSLALLGVVLGFFTGNARAAVVQAILPALLTFVAGMATYLATKESLATWRDVIPYGLASMLIAVILSVSHGLSLKRLAVEDELAFEQRKLDFEKVQLEVKKQLMLKHLGIVPGASAPPVQRP